MANMERSWKVSPYHLCMRCYRKIHISKMDWQLGLLLCREWCLDTGELPLIGMREQYISRVLNKGVQKELYPDEKLLRPTPGGLIEEVIL